ncbi:MAG: ACP S-malonyltransferase [Spirochaetales bacterium]|nr:ACP S-malonyltransferase [Spirochaetales bacterium]
MKRCFLYPGQGAQYSGMGKDLWEKSKPVQELFSGASDETGINLTKVLFEGTDEELRQTENTQVAVTVVSLAAMTYLREHEVTSDACAGFSLGEYAALVDAGVLSQKGVFRLVRKRGEFMADAALRLDGGSSGMAAVLGLNFEQASRVLDDLSGEDIFLANHSGPTQIVLSGSDKALSRADELFDKAGALRFVRLKVSGPFHCPLMKAARDDLAEYLKDIEFKDPVKPVFANVTGAEVSTGAEAQRLCVEQIVSPVRWVPIEEKIAAMSFDQIYEVGPGKVLTGLWKSFTKASRCMPAGTAEEIAGLAV